MTLSTTPPSTHLKPFSAAAVWLGCVLLAATVVSLPGTGAWVTRDDGNHLYAGQRLQEGVLPYTGIFNYVGSLSQFTCGAAIAVGRALGVDDVRATRLGFMLIVTLLAAAVVPFARRITGSSWGAVAAGVALVQLTPLIWFAAGGPEKYVLVVLFQVVAVAAVERRRWMLCGAACAAAGLTWQGGWLLLPISAVAVLFLERDRRVRQTARLLAGTVAAVATLVAVFAAFGGLPDFINAYVVFNVTHAGVGFPGFVAQLARIRTALAGSSPVWQLLCVGGIAALAVPGLWPKRRETGAVRLVLALTVGGYGLMALADFPSVLRLFPLFVPALVGVAVIAGRIGRSGRGLQAATAVLLVIGAVTAVGRSLAHPGTALERQLQGVRELRHVYGEDARIVALGAPEYLVLAGEVSPTPYLLFDRGIDRWIDSTYPGGFAGWSADLLRPAPDVIVLGYLEGDLPRRLRKELEQSYRQEKVGPWRILVRPVPATDGSRPPPDATPRSAPHGG